MFADMLYPALYMLQAGLGTPDTCCLLVCDYAECTSLHALMFDVAEELHSAALIGYYV